MIYSDQERAFAAPAIDLLRRRWPHLLEEIAKAPLSHDLSIIQHGPHPAFCFEGIQLASSYEPEGEAALQACNFDETTTEFTLYGVGMGYLVRHLLDTPSKLQKIHVYILNKSLFYSLLHWIDQSDWLMDSRVELHLPDRSTPLQTPSACTSPCLWLADDVAHQLRDQLFNALNTDFINTHWTDKTPELLKQIQENIDYVESDPGVADIIPNISGENPSEYLVVGAGPSLDSVQERLHQLVATGAKVIAVDRALHALKGMGITPNIIVAIDPDPKGIMNFPEDLAQYVATTLVYFPVVHHSVLSRWPHKRAVAYALGDTLYDDVENRHPKGRLYTSGTVLHSAIDLAVKSGASKVYLAGADFAFPYNKTHADNTARSRKADLDAGFIDSPLVVNGHGEKLNSQFKLIDYLRALETYITQHPSINFVNLSRDGARINGTSYEKGDNNGE